MLIDLDRLAKGVRMLGVLPNEHPNAATFNEALDLAARYLTSFIGREQYLPQVADAASTPESPVTRLRRFIAAMVSGTPEHGAFGRGFGGEYVPHPEIALEEVEGLLLQRAQEIADLELRLFHCEKDRDAARGDRNRFQQESTARAQEIEQVKAALVAVINDRDRILIESQEHQGRAAKAEWLLAAAPLPASAALQDLIAKWRAEAAGIAQIHATMGTGWRVCADELEAALSRADQP